MKYDLSNPLHRQQLRTRFELLIKKDHGIVELKECKPQTTTPQSRYVRVICAYFGCMTGYEADYVYSVFFKSTVNYDIFAVEFFDKIRNRQTFRLRHITDLTKDECSTAIDRFIQWAAKEAGVYIPSPEDHYAIRQMEMEVERNKSQI